MDHVNAMTWKGRTGCTRSLRRRALVVIGAGAAMLGSSLANAQQSQPDWARTLYQGAVPAAEKGDWASACPLFRASLLLVLRASTRYFTAKCDEVDGKLVLALDGYQAAMDMNRQTANAASRERLDEDATGAIKSLRSRIPSITIVVESAPARLQVKRDGQDVPPSLLNQPVDVDPGQHVIVASGPSMVEEEVTVSTIADGKNTTVKLRLKKRIRMESSIDNVPESKPAAAVATPPTTPTEPGRPSPVGVPTWAWVSGALGAASIGAGFAFLADDIATIGAIKTLCPGVGSSGAPACPTNTPGDQVSGLNARKNRDLPLLTAFYISGALGIGAAVIGATVRGGARPERPGAAGALVVAPWVAPGAGGAVIAGRF